jgi:hypothetical protein
MYCSNTVQYTHCKPTYKMPLAYLYLNSMICLPATSASGGDALLLQHDSHHYLAQEGFSPGQ